MISLILRVQTRQPTLLWVGMAIYGYTELITMKIWNGGQGFWRTDSNALHDLTQRLPCDKSSYIFVSELLFCTWVIFPNIKG